MVQPSLVPGQLDILPQPRGSAPVPSAMPPAHDAAGASMAKVLNNADHRNAARFRANVHKRFYGSLCDTPIHPAASFHLPPASR